MIIESSVSITAVILGLGGGLVAGFVGLFIASLMKMSKVADANMKEQIDKRNNLH